MDEGPNRVCLGVIGRPHGVRGLVRVRPFTAEPEAVAAYGLVESEDGARALSLTVVRRTGKGEVVVRVTGVDDRTTAEALTGMRFYVARDRLPPPDDPEEYYHADLVGLAAVGSDGRTLGTVRAVHNFGAGDLLEIAGADGSAVMVPFTRAVVTAVDIAAGHLVVEPPPGLTPGGGQ